MNFDDYMRETTTTAVYPNKGNNIFYPALGLGEAGEIQNQVKKIMRDDGGVITEERRLNLMKELGDLLWYVGAMCNELGVSMDTVHRRGCLTTRSPNGPAGITEVSYSSDRADALPGCVRARLPSAKSRGPLPGCRMRRSWSL